MDYEGVRRYSDFDVVPARSMVRMRIINNCEGRSIKRNRIINNWEGRSMRGLYKEIK